jgi:hypothetical protein
LKKDTPKSKAYKPVMWELRLPAAARRTFRHLPAGAVYVYYALTHTLRAHRGIHDDRIVAWFRTQAASGGADRVQEWARASSDLAQDVAAELRVLAERGLVALTDKRFQDANGDVYERVKVDLVPVEEWENDEMFMAGLAVRWPS